MQTNHFLAWSISPSFCNTRKTTGPRQFFFRSKISWGMLTSSISYLVFALFFGVLPVTGLSRIILSEINSLAMRGYWLRRLQNSSTNTKWVFADSRKTKSIIFFFQFSMHLLNLLAFILKLAKNDVLLFVAAARQLPTDSSTSKAVCIRFLRGVCAYQDSINGGNCQ